MRRRMWFPVLALSLCVIFGPIFAFAAESAPSAVVEKPAYEFPPQFDGLDVVHDFVVKNTGDAELKILDVKAG